MTHHFGSCLVLLLVSGCATSYGQQNLTGGYTDKQLRYNSFEIVFDGNAYTSSETVDDFAVLRAAELTIENGYQYFGILERKSFTTKNKVGKQTLVRHKTILIVVCFHSGNAPAEALKASEVIESLSKKY